MVIISIVIIKINIYSIIFGAPSTCQALFLVLGTQQRKYQVKSVPSWSLPSSD